MLRLTGKEVQAQRSCYLEHLAPKQCSRNVNMALLDGKVHTMFTGSDFLLEFWARDSKVPHLFSIFRWEADLHFPSDPHLSEAGFLKLNQLYNCLPED